MSFIAVAIGGSALIGGGVGLYAANKAADTQATAGKNALAFQQKAYDTSQGNINAAKPNYQPWLDVGSKATYTLGQLTGSAGSQPDFSSFYNSPDYQFAQQQGEQGIERGANARGMNLSGGTLRDLSSFNSGLATQQYGNYYSRLMGLSQMGQNAASGLGNLAVGQATNATNASGQIGNTIQGIGQAQASGIVGGSNAITGSLNSGVSNSLLYNYLGKSPSAYGDANPGSSTNPLPGLTKADYGAGY
jgi:hypothetical protein